MAGELPELPPELIQHIQSFLNEEEAARASVLSNLWYSAWSTRPILSLDCSNFDSITDFENYARTSINRYQQLNLKPNTFKLDMNPGYCNDDEFTSLVDELISCALTLGVNDLDVSFSHYTSLPHQVFSSIYLKRLYIRWVNIDLPQSNGKPRVLCSRLVLLELFCVNHLTDDMMRDILLGCPLIEDLRIISCDYLAKINLSAVRCSLRNFLADGFFLVEWAENNAPGLQNQFHNLITLKLEKVKVDDLFFKFFSHRFPCLERLELEECEGSMINIDIASNSLRYLTLIGINGLKFCKVQLALNIQNFRFESRPEWAQAIPPLSFLTASEEWKSDLRFYQPSGKDRDVQVSWLLKVRDILTELSMSKISITIVLSSCDQLGSVLEEIIQSNHISPFVENLKLDSWISHKNSFVWLLCCRPKYLTWIGLTHRNSCYEVIALTYNELKNHENKNLTDALPCIHGLEEVDMEHYHQTLREWHPVQPGTEEAADIEGEFRLRLKWMDQKGT